MTFGVTLAGDVFQHKLDNCFGHIKNVIVIADDIMIVGKKQNQTDHDQALIALLETARRCNVWLNHEKLQYKKDEVDFFGGNLHNMWLQASSKQGVCNYSHASSNMQNASSIIYWHDQLSI